MVLITIVTGAYKPTYNWGPHIVTNQPFIFRYLKIQPTIHCSYYHYTYHPCWKGQIFDHIFFLEREFATEHVGNSIYQAAESTWEAKPSLATCQCFSFMVCHGQIVGRFPWGASASPSRHHLPVAHGASRHRPFVVVRRPLRWPALRARQRGIASVLPVWT